MDKPVQILLIEDSPLFVELTRRMLAESKSVQFVVECVGNLAEGIDRLSQDGIDAVLLDLTLPDSNGLDTFLRLQAVAKSVPTVIYTSVDDEALSLAALNHGAADYLVKSEVNPNWLARSLVYAIQRSLPSKPVATKPESTAGRHGVSVERSWESEWSAKVSEKRLVTAPVLEELQTSLLGLIGRSECQEIHVDMSQIEYISNAAISMLLIVHKLSTTAGKRVVFFDLRPQVYEQFSSRRFDKLFHLRQA